MNYEEFNRGCFEEAKRLYESANADQKYVLESLYPELKESEDERIRKVLIELSKEVAQEQFFINRGTNLQNVIAWLEKQGDKDKLIKELGEYKAKYTQEVLEKHLNNMSNKDNERLRKTTISFLKEFADKGYENAVECIDWLEKQGEQKPILNVPTREVILSIWDLGNEWKELTNGCISTEYGTQLDYIQKHWHESEYYLREKQSEQKADYTTLVETGNGGINAFVTRELSTNGYSEQKSANEVEPKCEESKTKIFDAPTPFEDKLYVFVAACEFLAIPSKIEFILEHSQEILDAAREQIGKEQSSAWSEEDEVVVEDIEEAVINYWHGQSQEDLLDWLKSLKTKVQPKQEWSEKDEEELEIAIDTLKESGRYDSAKWVQSLKRRIGGKL